MTLRVTRSRALAMEAAGGGGGEAAVIQAPVVRAVKRKAKAGPTPRSTSQQPLQTQDSQSDKENASSDAAAPLSSTDAMRLVARAYAQTLSVKASEVRALAHELDVLAITSNSTHTAARSPKTSSPKTASPRAPLQPRDTNRPVEAEGQLKPVVLSPRTLLVPSTIRPADIATHDPHVAMQMQMPRPQTQTQTQTQLQPQPQPLAKAASAPAPHAIQCDDQCEESLSDDDEEDEEEEPRPVLLAPTTPSMRKIDTAHQLPSPYVTINPDLLRDAAWNFRDLQLLCMRLGLGGRGTRDQLVERLLAWHRQCFHKREADEEEEDDHPLSIRKRMKHASNFSLLQFDTSAMMGDNTTPPLPAAAAAAAAPSTPPLSPENDGHANGPLAHVTVASSLPQLMTPLLYRSARKPDGHPRSILSPSLRPKSSKRLSFSVFNGVKLIPSRQVSNEELNATPSPTKTLCMDEGDEEEMDERDLSDSIDAPQFEELPPAASSAPHQQPQQHAAPPRPSFLSSVSSAIMSALSPRKLAPTQPQAPQPTIPSFAHTSAFTFDRLPSIEARHGDESESDLSMEM